MGAQQSSSSPGTTHTQHTTGSWYISQKLCVNTPRKETEKKIIIHEWILLLLFFIEDLRGKHDRTPMYYSRGEEKKIVIPFFFFFFFFYGSGWVGDMCVQDTRQRWLRWGIAHQRSRRRERRGNSLRRRRFFPFLKTSSSLPFCAAQRAEGWPRPFTRGPMASDGLPRPTTGSARNLVRIGGWLPFGRWRRRRRREEDDDDDFSILFSFYFSISSLFFFLFGSIHERKSLPISTTIHGREKKKKKETRDGRNDKKSAKGGKCKSTCRHNLRESICLYRVPVPHLLIMEREIEMGFLFPDDNWERGKKTTAAGMSNIIWWKINFKFHHFNCHILGINGIGCCRHSRSLSLSLCVCV